MTIMSQGIITETKVEHSPSLGWFYTTTTEFPDGVDSIISRIFDTRDEATIEAAVAVGRAVANGAKVGEDYTFTVGVRL